MECIPKSWTIELVSRKKPKINPKPPYQRGEVWSVEKKENLIDSILRGYDIPKIYLRKTEGEYTYEVVDGQQRLRAIWAFKDDEVHIGEISKDLEDKYGSDFVGKKFSELKEETQDIFFSTELAIVEIREADEVQIRDLFLRLQEGVTLNPPEKRNAMIGNMRDFISDLTNNRITAKINKANKRNLYDDWLAHITALEIYGGSCNLKADDLKKMYRDNQDFKNDGTVANKIHQTLNYMTKTLDDNDNPPEMNIKWGFVDFYHLLTKSIDKYVTKNRHEDFGLFYITFEGNRREVEEPADLISSGRWLDERLYYYITAFQKEGANKDNVQIRHDVYFNFLFEYYQDFTPKDKTRLFNDSERTVIWRKADCKCEICRKKIELTEMHADHIIPFAQGGLTTLDNARCLCVTCNTSNPN